MTEKVVGLDGCKDGWIAAVVIDRKLCAIEFHKSAQAALKAHCDAEAFAFDIPIGLSCCGYRKADDEAKDFLKPYGRSNSVFPAPPREVVETAVSYGRGTSYTYSEAYQLANTETKRISDRGLSHQSFGLFRKIREVSRLAKDCHVFEAHPEVTLAKLAGNQPLPSKKSWSGLKKRIELLCGEGLAVLDVEDRTCGQAAPDDAVDAVACAWTADRIARCEAQSLPEPPECIDGRKVAIWC